MNKVIAGPLKWHGGKAYLASRIVAMMPPHLHYVEPFAGGLSVLLAKDPEGVSEVVNDLNDHLTNFWNVLADDVRFAEFSRRVQATPFSENAFNAAMTDDGPWVEGCVTSAYTFFVRCRQSLAGRMDAFAPLSRNRIRRGMNEQASAWMTCIEGLPAVHARLKRVVILNHDALKVIEQQDGPQTLFYLDPPYLHETRSTTGEYQYEMSDEQHRSLLKLLSGISGKFMLSGYHSDLYDNSAAMHGWHCIEFELPNNAAGGKEKQRKIECVWANFDLANKEAV
jgi:DNA adenine methylase